MTYKTMRRKGHAQVIGKKEKAIEAGEAFLDGCLKEGTDQGWTLHSMYQEVSDTGLTRPTNWHIFIWETND